MKSKKCIAMILAGGKGTRLGMLTKYTAKPAVPFGSKYRMIDFTLSNCINSNIDTIGILTQYEPYTLNTYISKGSPWCKAGYNCGGIFVLPPYLKESGGTFYKGTANAIYQHSDFIEQFNPDYLLVLSGDHIYKMDYSKMIQYHIEKKADATIAVMEVSLEEACRFGIMNVSQNGIIEKFEEKPNIPRSNLASMGVYVFNWSILKHYLIEDELTPHSNNDFGKNIIPKMLSEQNRMYSYRFRDYWRDVGTIESYYEANMDLLSNNPLLDIYDENWPIYTAEPIYPPNYFSSTSTIKNSLIDTGCKIWGSIENSVLFSNIEIGENSIVKNSIIMRGSKIGNNITIENSIIGENTVVCKGCRIGCNNLNLSEHQFEKQNISITTIGEKTTVPMNTIIENAYAVWMLIYYMINNDINIASKYQAY